MTSTADRRAYSGEPEDHRTFSTGRKWFSANDDKAWAEEFYLFCYTPIWLAIAFLIVKMGWMDIGNFWHVMQNVLWWAPGCVLLPLYLRRKVAIPIWKQWWFKYQLYMIVITVMLSYFLFGFFTEVMGLRSSYPSMTLYLDSQLCGPDRATALANHQRMPIGMPIGAYINTFAFFTIYHTTAVVVIRRAYNTVKSWGAPAKSVVFLIAVMATAWFWAFMETRLFVSSDALSTASAWYINLPKMLIWGSWIYMILYVLTFSNVYRLDESPDRAPWSLSRVVTEALAVCMLAMFLFDLITMLIGKDFMAR